MNFKTISLFLTFFILTENKGVAGIISDSFKNAKDTINCESTIDSIKIVRMAARKKYLIPNNWFRKKMIVFSQQECEWVIYFKREHEYHDRKTGGKKIIGISYHIDAKNGKKTSKQRISIKLPNYE